jgi:hypothetical protein
MRKLLFTICAVFVLIALCALPYVNSVDARSVESTDNRVTIGSFTGPINGAAQDDNIKASLDLAHTDLDSILANQNGTGTTIAGMRYASKMTSLAIDDDLFDVDGGAIYIYSFVGLVSTVMQAQANTLEIELDADTGWTDYDFSTGVETNGDAAGTRYVFTQANESVLTPLEGADGGATDLMSGGGWYCGEGMIELNAQQAAQTGGVDWYMIWTPYEDGTTVTAQ